MKQVFITLLLVCSVAMGCDKRDEQLASSFRSIEIGVSRGDVLRVMGKPDSSDYSNLIGLSSETLRWKHGRTIFEATFINGLVISKKMTDQKGDKNGN